MRDLYDDLIQNQLMPNAFSDWTAYRAALTDFILQNTQPGTAALIVGAGPCSDLDLVRLKRHFGKVTLLDRDEQAMRAGIARQGVSCAPDEIVCADLVGIAPDTYRRIADHMLAALRAELRSGNPDKDRFEQAFLQQMASAFQHRRPDARMERSDLADHVICCGVHSQLMTIFLQMAMVYRRFIPIRCDLIADFVREQIPSVVSGLNDALLRWARKGVILGLEESRLGMEGGIDGAFQAWMDMTERGLVPQAWTRLVWPFDPAQDKAYWMRVMAIQHRRTGASMEEKPYA